jgi:hypothetical protein
MSNLPSYGELSRLGAAIREAEVIRELRDAAAKRLHDLTSIPKGEVRPGDFLIQTAFDPVTHKATVPELVAPIGWFLLHAKHEQPISDIGAMYMNPCRT